GDPVRLFRVSLAERTPSVPSVLDLAATLEMPDLPAVHELLVADEADGTSGARPLWLAAGAHLLCLRPDGRLQHLRPAELQCELEPREFHWCHLVSHASSLWVDCARSTQGRGLLRLQPSTGRWRAVPPLFPRYPPPAGLRPAPAAVHLIGPR